VRPPLASLARRLSCFGLVLLPAAASAQQQGAIPPSTETQVLSGSPARRVGERPYEPDAGLLWTQPGTRFGQFELESIATRRGSDLHLGRTRLALRDAKVRGLTWTFEAGDLYSPNDPGDYQFSNLATPSLMFAGGLMTARSARTVIQVMGGRTNALRNIFGSDPQMLGQTLGLARVTFEPNPRWTLNTRAARTRTSNVLEFTRSVDASEQAGGGARYVLTPSIHLVADASYVEFRATGATERTRDYSYVAGAHALLARGSVQVNATRFSPGDLPVLNAPLQDRSGVFASGEYDVFSRARLFGGWESVDTNINPYGVALLRPEATANRGFAGARVRVATRSMLSFRVEDGGRVATPVLTIAPLNGFVRTVSDTGAVSAEWQTGFRTVTAFGRFARRNNLSVSGVGSTFTQSDASGQAFVNLSRQTQLFGGSTVTRQNDISGRGSTFVQLSAGGQQKVLGQGLWLRVEATGSQNRDRSSGILSPRSSLAVGLNGQLSRNTSIGLNVYVDRAPAALVENDEACLARSTLRLVHTIPSGSARLPGAGAVSDGGRAVRGTGSIVGTVFADWNGNGQPDAGEELLSGIGVRLGAASIVTGRDGQFSFANVPSGALTVGIDSAALPVDFDGPANSDITLQMSRGDARRVAFGLVPLGLVLGRIVEDANRNGSIDPDEPGVDNAVLALDGGQRSELARRGAFRFEAVRAGNHRVELLKESLPDGAVIVGETERSIAITREHPRAEIAYLVRIEKRPEVRKVFPPKVGLSNSRPPQRTGRAATTVVAAVRPARPAASVDRSSTDGAVYTIQIAALNDPLRAHAMVADLASAGFAAYLVEPSPSDPDGPFRVRVGRFPSRTLAQQTAGALESRLNQKLWVTRSK
jgi:cell division septation protein DedD